LKNYFYAVIKPCVEAIFGVTLTFKSEDFDQITSSLETLKTFELTSEEYISSENKRIILNKLFGLPENSKGDEVDEPEPEVIPPVLDSSLDEGEDNA
jgi:hypothetical protein